MLLVAAFAGVGVLPLVLARAFGVSFAVSALIVVLLAVIYWAAGSDSVLMERGLKGRVVGFDALLPWIRGQSNTPVEFQRLAHFSAGL